MTLIIKILSVIGLILLVLLTILLLVVIFPRHFWIEYTVADNLVVKMNLLLFKVRLLPLPKFVEKLINKKKDTTTEEKQEKPEKSEKQKEGEKKKQSPLDNIQLSFDLIQQVLSAAKGIMKRVLKAIKFSDISFTVPLMGKDAYETQKLYGNVTMAFYTFNTYIQRYVQVYYNRPIFVADFVGQHKNSTYFYMQITASPLLLIFAGLFGLKQYRLIMKTNQKAQAEEKEI